MNVVTMAPADPAPPCMAPADRIDPFEIVFEQRSVAGGGDLPSAAKAARGRFTIADTSPESPSRPHSKTDVGAVSSSTHRRRSGRRQKKQPRTGYVTKGRAFVRKS